MPTRPISTIQNPVQNIAEGSTLKTHNYFGVFSVLGGFTIFSLCSLCPLWQKK